MTDTKMLQAILDGQSAIKEELKNEIKILSDRVSSLESKVDEGFGSVNERIDKLGLPIANLEDDAPTLSEFDDLEKRVTILEETLIKASTNL